MKLNIRTEGLFEKPEFDDGGNELGSQELVYSPTINPLQY